MTDSLTAIAAAEWRDARERTRFLDLHTVRPPRLPAEDLPSKEAAKIELIAAPDMAFAILRGALGWSQADTNAAAAESTWVMEMFEEVDGEELYDRYLRLCDRIDGTDISAGRV